MNKRYVSIFLVMCMLLTGFGRTSAYASSEESLEMQYVLEVLSGYLVVNDNLEYEELFVSTQRHIYNIDGSESEKNYYLLLSADEVLGTIMVEKHNNLFSSYFMTDAVGTLSNLYAEGEPFALSMVNGNLLLVTEQKYEIIVNDYFGAPLTEVTITNLLDKLAIVTVVDISQSPAVISAGNTYTVTGPPPPHVGNVGNPANGAGLCWAACIASVINYRRGNVSETANSIFMDCWYTVDYSQGDIPRGTTEWMITAFEVNSIYDITYVEDSLTVSEIETMLGTYSRPIISVIYADREDGTTGSHAVVMYEFFNGGSYGYYKIMDPNHTSYVTVSLTYDSFNNSTYFPYGDYTRWESSYY